MPIDECVQRPRLEKADAPKTYAMPFSGGAEKTSGLSDAVRHVSGSLELDMCITERKERKTPDRSRLKYCLV